MKIAIVSNFFSKDRGGAIGIAYTQALELSKRGYDISAFTSAEDDDLGWAKKDGIKTYKVKVKRLRYILRSYLCLFNLRLNKEFNKFLKEVKPDIIHFNNLFYQLPFSLIKIAKKYAKGVFLTAHDVGLICYEKFIFSDEKLTYKVGILDQVKQAGRTYNPFRNIIIRHYLKYVDKIFCVSNALKDFLKTNGIKNTEVIYNGIDINDWNIDVVEMKNFKKRYDIENKKVLIFGGRLSAAKGGDQILKTAALVKKQIDKVILLVAGEENEYLKKMKEAVKRLKIEKNVIFIGWLKQEELRVAFHSVDVSVSPSLCFETFGMNNLIAMACKKPVISSYFGGPKEVVIDGETGYLVNPNNIELMAEKIIDLLKNPEKAKKFGEAGYQRAKEKFSLDKQVDKILKWYKKHV